MDVIPTSSTFKSDYLLHKKKDHLNKSMNMSELKLKKKGNIKKWTNTK